MIYNYGISTGTLSDSYENEYLILSQLISHDNIIKIITKFIDRPTEEMLNFLPEETKLKLLKEPNFKENEERTRSSIVMIMEYFPNDLKKLFKTQF